MARIRKIDEDTVLNAAEQVVVRLGAANLSIDAVAREAGISKSRVVYDYKSKTALLEALIDRRLDQDRTSTEAAVASSHASPNPELYGRIDIAAPRPDVADHAVMLAISASLASNSALRERLRIWTGEDIDAVTRDTDRPLAALIAYLALTGFSVTEHFELHHWDDAERQRILAAVRTVFTSFPEPGPDAGASDESQPS